MPKKIAPTPKPKPPPRWILAGNLRALLKKKGFTTYSDAAELCGIPQAQFSRYVNGVSPPTPRNLARLLAGLDATERELLECVPDDADDGAARLNALGRPRRAGAAGRDAPASPVSG